MAVTLVQSNAAVTTGALGATMPAWGVTPTKGNLLLVVVNETAGTNDVWTGPTGYTAVTGTPFVYDSADSAAVGIYWKIAGTGETTPTSVSDSAGTQNWVVYIYEYASTTGWKTSPPNQAVKTSSASATSIASGNTGVLAQDDELAVVMTPLDTAGTALTYTNGFTVARGGLGSNLLWFGWKETTDSRPLSTTASWTTAAIPGIWIVTFMVATTTPVPPATRAWAASRRGIRSPLAGLLSMPVRRVAPVFPNVTVFTDTGTGAWIWAGGRTESKRGTDTRSGAWIWAGGRTESKLGVNATSGAWIWAGGRTESRTGADTRTGAVVFGGQLDWEGPILGRVQHQRQLPLQRALRDPRAMRRYAGYRGFNAPSFVDAMLGTWIFGRGATSDAKRGTDSRSGAWIWAGTRVETKRGTDSRTGTWLWAGTATQAKIGSDARTGTWIWAGSRSEAWTGSTSRAGTILFGRGSTSDARVGSDSRAGSVVLARGTTSERKAYSDTRPGSVVFGGLATATLTHSATRSGTWIWTGLGSAAPPSSTSTLSFRLVSDSRGRRRRTLR